MLEKFVPFLFFFFYFLTGKETSLNKGAFFPATAGTDVGIYYSKHQSCIFLLFSKEQNVLYSQCDGAKMRQVLF